MDQISRVAAVVGSGPAGLATVASLLDANQNTIIHWFDPSFSGGRLVKYPEVPSPSLSILLQNYSTTLSPDPLQSLKGLDQTVGCDLVVAQRFCHFLIDRIKEVYPDRITFHQGWVSNIEFTSKIEQYEIEHHQNIVDKFDSIPNFTSTTSTKTKNIDSLFLCTGAVPVTGIPSSPHIKHASSSGNPPRLLELDVCLSPSKLAKEVNEKDTVIIVGSSHSAILCLKNLVELKSRPRILNFHLHGLKYAEYKDGWILYDNTGLKQMAARWAKANIEDANNALKIGIERIKVTNEDEVYAKYAPEATRILYAVGFKPRDVPMVLVDGKKVERVSHDPHCGKLLFDGKLSHNASGFGIGFPEKVTDPVGNVETSVGLWKFMRYIRECLIDRKEVH